MLSVCLRDEYQGSIVIQRSGQRTVLVIGRRGWRNYVSMKKVNHTKFVQRSWETLSGGVSIDEVIDRQRALAAQKSHEKIIRNKATLSRVI